MKDREITATGIHAGYKDGEDILSGVDLVARPGEITTLIGPNGCGKSTLLKTLSKILRPRQGSVHIGEPVSYTHLTLPTILLV